MINPAYSNIDIHNPYVYKYYKCGTKLIRGKNGKVSFTECIGKFMNDMNFINVETSKKGDCFYDSLSKFGKRTGNPKTNKTTTELRNIIIGDMIHIMSNSNTKNQISDFIIPDDEDALPFTTDQQKIKQLQEYLDPYKWFGRTGDIIPQKAADILDINIIIYDLHEYEDSYYFNRLRYFGTNMNDMPVIMLRIHGNHYRLLWPRDAVKSKSKHKSNNKSHNKSHNKPNNKSNNKSHKSNNKSVKNKSNNTRKNDKDIKIGKYVQEFYNGIKTYKRARQYLRAHLTNAEIIDRIGPEP
jgi:hypothetical protein